MRKYDDNGPKLTKFRSADVASPYILACTKAEANSRLVTMSLNGIQMLLDFEVFPPADSQQILSILAQQVYFFVTQN